MLYELTPSIEVTGGPWFTNSELDKEFVNELLTPITKPMISKSFPKLPTRGAPPGYTSYPTLNQVYLSLKGSNLTEVDLAEADIRSLPDVLAGKMLPRGKATLPLSQRENLVTLEGTVCGSWANTKTGQHQPRQV